MHTAQQQQKWKQQDQQKKPAPTPEEIRRQLGFELKSTRGTR